MSDALSLLPPTVQCAALPDWRVVRVSGADAVSFLHAQLTQDVAGLQAGDVRLAAYCNAKGRMQASMLIWREVQGTDLGESVFMLVHASVVEAVVKRLRMFVLRSKVVLEISENSVYGAWSASAVDAAAPGLGQRASLADGAELLGARPVDGASWRAWVVAAGQELPAELQARVQAEAESQAQTEAGTGARAWQVQEILVGTPWVTSGNFELFTPLLVNLDLIDGVSFTKGCYPGQEVVARSHYRGKQRRRMMRASASLDQHEEPELTALDGKDICSPEAREPLGYIVNSVTHQGTVHLLFEAAMAAAQSQPLRLLTPEGLPAELQGLPYPLPSEME